MVSQGAKAVESGSSFQDKIKGLLDKYEISYEPQVSYRALWYGSKMNKMDYMFNKEGLRYALECKFQNSAGTADMKGYAEIWNAYKAVPCDVFVLLYGGTWWHTDRGVNIFSSVQQMARELQALADKIILVMHEDDFEQWLSGEYSNAAVA